MKDGKKKRKYPVAMLINIVLLAIASAVCLIIAAVKRGSAGLSLLVCGLALAAVCVLFICLVRIYSREYNFFLYDKQTKKNAELSSLDYAGICQRLSPLDRAFSDDCIPLYRTPAVLCGFIEALKTGNKNVLSPLNAERIEAAFVEAGLFGKDRVRELFSPETSESAIGYFTAGIAVLESETVEYVKANIDKFG